MSNDVAQRAGAEGWSALLEATRTALTLLCAEDLEELAARAEVMRHETSRSGAAPALQGAELARVTAEQQLLRELLLATDSNLRVLRCLRQRAAAREVDPRWVR